MQVPGTRTGSPAPGTTAGGRVLTSAPRRAEPIPVPLKVDKLHAAAILEEWTSSHTLTVWEVVASRGWRDVQRKHGALDLARSLDVAMASGLDVAKEPWAEVALRAIAATWFADRHPKEAEIAELLKESSMNHFGLPRGLLEDARTFRKLLSKAGADGDLP